MWSYDSYVMFTPLDFWSHTLDLDAENDDCDWMTSWWFQPIWKILDILVKMGIFPNFRGENNKIFETTTKINIQFDGNESLGKKILKCQGNPIFSPRPFGRKWWLWLDKDGNSVVSIAFAFYSEVAAPAKLIGAILPPTFRVEGGKRSVWRYKKCLPP